jgi:hypothetical protein
MGQPKRKFFKVGVVMLPAILALEAELGRLQVQCQSGLYRETLSEKTLTRKQK